MASSAADDIADADLNNCEAADKFCKLFYENYDHDRKRVKEMYSKTACLVWCGHDRQGQQEIGDFLERLPSSNSSIRSLDVQTVPEKCTDGRGALLVTAAGTARVHGRPTPFVQTFLLVVEEAKWRIVMDRFRYLGDV